MPELFPTFDVGQTIEEVEETEAQNAFKPSVYFDDEIGDFRTNGAGQIITASGHEAWKQWCINAVQTERFSCLGFSDNFGIEIENVLSQSDKDVCETLVRSSITEALTADSRTKDVSEFVFTWDTDSVEVICVATSIAGDKANIRVEMG